MLERGGRRDRLPDLVGILRPGNQRQRLDEPTAIGDAARRQLEVLAVVRERLVLEGELDDLERLVGDLAVHSIGVGHVGVVERADRHAVARERLDLARHGAATDAEDRPPTREVVQRREVLGQSQRVPLGDDVEHRPDADAARCARRGTRRTGCRSGRPRSPRAGSGARSASSCRSRAPRRARPCRAGALVRARSPSARTAGSSVPGARPRHRRSRRHRRRRPLHACLHHGCLIRFGRTSPR